MCKDKIVLQQYSEYERFIEPLNYEYLQYETETILDNVKLNIGSNSDLEKAHILMNYTFKSLIPGNDDYPKVKDKCNSIFILNSTKAMRIKSNCYMYCVVLVELLLCYGIKSRVVICRPIEFYKTSDCHCMVHAYIKELKKWIALDPANCSSFRDKDGSFINVSEIRRKIIENKPYYVFCSTRDHATMIKEYLPYYLGAFFSLRYNGFNLYSTEAHNEVNVLLPVRFKRGGICFPHTNITFNDFSFWSN